MAAVIFSLPSSYTDGSVDEDGIISYIRRAPQFLFDAKNRPGLAGIMRETLGAL